MQINSIEEYKKLRKYMLDTKLPTITTRRGLQKGAPFINLVLNISDLLDWREKELLDNTTLSKIVKQEVDLILNGNTADKYGLYKDDHILQKAYANSGRIGRHSLRSRNVPIIVSDPIKCIESLWFLPPFDKEYAISYRMTHRSFDIKSAGYSDLLIAAELIKRDAVVNNILSRVEAGQLFWTAYNATIYVEDDGITPIKGVARRV